MKLHALIDGKILCGIHRTDKMMTLPPRLCRYVTCVRCLASLKKP